MKWRSTVVILFCCSALLTVLSLQSEKLYVSMGGKKYALDVSENEPARQKGLGERNSMQLDEGMLFVFDKAEMQCFWMKDMRFSIDIIWLDEAKRVVHIEPNVSPDTFPQSFCPKAPAKYVIELNSGETAKSSINIGNQIRF